MTRVTPAAAALLLLGFAGSCFQIEPLGDCAVQDGLYLPYHVCMPLARSSLPVAGEPRALVIGDFDADGAIDDLAVLHDEDAVTLHVGLDGEAVTTRELDFTGGSATVGGILSANFLGDKSDGEDLFGWVTRSPPLASELIALPNGGDLFAGPALVRSLTGFPIDGGGPMGVPRPCYAPNSGLDLVAPEGLSITGLMVITCVPDGAFTGPLSGDFLAEELPDAIVIPDDGGFEGGLFASFVGKEYRSVGAAQLSLFDPVAMTGGLVIAHRPPGAVDAEIAIVDTVALDASTAVAVKPRQGSIDAIRVADLDQDGDLDLLAIHLEKTGFSIIRHEPGTGAFVTFGEPEYYTLEVELSDLALGDFTGDGGLDIAVAHTIDNSSLDGITIYALDLEQPGGPVPYAPALVGSVRGTIVGLQTLDIDGDKRDDLAVAVRDGSQGFVNLYVNRAAAR